MEQRAPSPSRRRFGQAMVKVVGFKRMWRYDDGLLLFFSSCRDTIESYVEKFSDKLRDSRK